MPPKQRKTVAVAQRARNATQHTPQAQASGSELSGFRLRSLDLYLTGFDSFQAPSRAPV